MAYAAGVDVGSTQTKAVIIDEKKKIVGRSLTDTGANVVAAAQNAYDLALGDGKVAEEEVAYVVGTGYGRYRVTFGNTQVTEISCHGRGAVHMFPGTRTVVDMGGQDTKAIRVRGTGEIDDFCMNDKCAAGTGRFLGAAAAALDMTLDDLGPTALKAEKGIKISTTCTVFAESEVLSWIGKGKKIEDILWGVHKSIAIRSAALLRRVGVESEVTFTGGVTRNAAMVKALEDKLELKMNLSEDSHYMGALGAALFALDHILSSRVPHDSAEVKPSITAGIDVGSTYTKTIVLDAAGKIVGREMCPTGFKLAQAARNTFEKALESGGLTESDVDYVITTGIGRHQVEFCDLQVTDFTASARGAIALFPGTRTVLDIGGQTMKVSRLDEASKVLSFRLNDKCAAGTGAFLEKTARYMGYTTTEIGPLIATSKESVPISGVCAVFAESEVINHLSQGTPPADIMQGAIQSLTARSVQLMKRAKAEPEYTLTGGILRFSTMADAVRAELKAEVNVPDEEMVQYVLALGAATLGHRRLEKLRADGVDARPGANAPAGN